MIDIHLFYGIEIEYEAYKEFEIFPTLEHAYNYIVDKVLIRNEYDPKTLKSTRNKKGFMKNLFNQS